MVWQELVASGRVSPSDFVRLTSTAAAQIFNIYPRKGVVRPGGDLSRGSARATPVRVLMDLCGGSPHATNVRPRPLPRAPGPGPQAGPRHAPPHAQIAEGSDADVIIFDPALEHTLSAASHHSAMDTNIYEGYRVQGKVCACGWLGLGGWGGGWGAGGGTLNREGAAPTGRSCSQERRMLFACRWVCSLVPVSLPAAGAHACKAPSSFPPVGLSHACFRQMSKAVGEALR